MLMPNWMDPEYLLHWLGDWALWGTALVVFIECGLLFPILPGDSLLFAVGLFIAAGTISVPLWLACVILTVAAFLGNVSGYYIGRVLGTTLFTNPNARFLKPKYLVQTHEFFERYGARALVLGRFVPIVRTFITVVAGAGRMEPKKFFLWTGIGAVLWATGITLLGHALGQREVHPQPPRVDADPAGAGLAGPDGRGVLPREAPQPHRYSGGGCPQARRPEEPGHQPHQRLKVSARTGNGARTRPSHC